MSIRVTASLFGALLLVALAAPAAADTACFDWDCNPSTHLCSFDAGCSSYTGPLWRFRWDFGDSSGYYFTGSDETTHQYPTGGGNCYFDVELTVFPWSDPSSVTCTIVVEDCFGPPLGNSGRCSG